MRRAQIVAYPSTSGIFQLLQFPNDRLSDHGRLDGRGCVSHITDPEAIFPIPSMHWAHRESALVARFLVESPRHRKAKKPDNSPAT
jgi:hypothetical protein